MFTEFDLGLIIFALCFSAFIKGSLGLGFSTISLAILANAIDLKLAISIVIIPSFLSNLIIMQSVGNFRHSISLFWPMFIATMVGMSIGLTILTQAPQDLPKLLLGLVLMLYGVWGITNTNFRIKASSMPILSPLSGVLTGIFNGATGSQIFPIMPYLLSLPISKEVMLQTINLSFTLCSIIMLTALWHIGEINLQQAWQFSLGVIPVVIGMWLGGKVRRKLSDQRFRQSVMILIIVLGFGLSYKVLS